MPAKIQTKHCSHTGLEHYCQTKHVQYVGVANTVEGTEKFRRQWTAQVDRIKDNMLSKTVIQYSPQGRRNVERPNLDSTE